ncbi:MAG: hypothetical protein P1V35_07765 [Planctomycetota bacterium]|nr:hypothetical protein [Planctomycetota bacterium]
MKRIISATALAWIAILACSSPQESQPKGAQRSPVAHAQPAGQASQPPAHPATEVAPYQATYPPTATSEPEPALLDFASNAFPPTMPENSSHANAWLKDDCLSCHGDGINGAPRLAHRGMPQLLKQARCRTCHIPRNEALATAEGAGLEQLLFARNAFPPTLPNDKNHVGAWLRDDCLRCHQGGIGGAPRVLHQGMPDLLLEARCRSCHVSSAASGVMDYPDK